MQAAQFLVGKWNCAHTVGDFSGTYTTTFTSALPGRAGSAVWTKKGDTEYTVDGPTYPSNGKVVTEHHDCRKAV